MPDTTDEWKKEMEGLSDLKSDRRKHLERTEEVSKRITGLETAREEDQQHSRSGNLKITDIPEDLSLIHI